MFRLPRRGRSARWRLLMFNEVTLRGFQSNHKHSTRIFPPPPPAPAKETFLSLSIAPRAPSPASSSCNLFRRPLHRHYSGAGAVSAARAFARPNEWLQMETWGLPRLSGINRSKINEIVCFSCSVPSHRMRFLGREKPKQITDFLVRWPSDDSNYHFFYRENTYARTIDRSLPESVENFFGKSSPRQLFLCAFDNTLVTERFLLFGIEFASPLLGRPKLRKQSK